MSTAAARKRNRQPDPESCEELDIEQSQPVTKKGKNPPVNLQAISSEFSKIMRSEFKTLSDSLSETITTRVSAQIETVTSSVAALADVMKVHETRITALEASSKGLQETTSSHNRELELLQIQTRKLNLIVVGLYEDTKETEASLMQEIQSFIGATLGLEEVPIDNAYRLGPRRTDSRPRNIKVKFICESHRNKVWMQRGLLREKKLQIYINEDVPPVTQNRRALLREECSKAYRCGKRAKLHGDRLVIDDITYEINVDGVLVQCRDRNRRLFQPPTLTTGISATKRASNLY
jgi:DNA-binding protein H-NS